MTKSEDIQSEGSDNLDSTPIVEEVEPSDAKASEVVEDEEKLSKIPVAGDYLMWVEREGEPTIKSFIKSAESGVRKRISKLPRDMVVKESKFFLAHDEGIHGDSVVFGMFIPAYIEIVGDVVPEGMPEFTKCIPVTDENTEGEIYLVSEDIRPFITPMDLSIKQNFTSEGGLAVLKRFRDVSYLTRSHSRKALSYIRIADAVDFILNSPEKTSPLSRIEKTVELSGDALPASGARWSDEERNELRRLVELRGRLSVAFAEFARQTNRSIRSIEYQWYKMNRAVALTPEDVEVTTPEEVATDTPEDVEVTVETPEVE